MQLSLGYSPCPNDCFIFYGLAHKKVADDLDWRVVLADVEELNQRAVRADLDVTKLSFHAYGQVSGRYVMLSSGAALGRAVGPLIVTREPLADLAGRRVATPGGLTTATLLLALSQPEPVELIELRYDRIMPAVASGEVDAGLIIHESRFTFADYGLCNHLDLGEWWEAETGLPIPLGGIAARRSLGVELLSHIEAAVRDSLAFARSYPEQTEPYVAQHAQEMAHVVRQQHIDLYVNDFSSNLGQLGRKAVRALLAKAKERGLAPDVEGALFVSDLENEAEA